MQFEEALQHDKYHHEQKGCKFHKGEGFDELGRKLIDKIHWQTYRLTKNNKIVRVLGLKCLTHKKECSRTGWEWGWYNGAESKALPSFNNEYVKAIWAKYNEDKKLSN